MGNRITLPSDNESEASVRIDSNYSIQHLNELASEYIPQSGSSHENNVDRFHSPNKFKPVDIREYDFPSSSFSNYGAPHNSNSSNVLEGIKVSDSPSKERLSKKCIKTPLGSKTHTTSLPDSQKKEPLLQSRIFLFQQGNEVTSHTLLFDTMMEGKFSNRGLHNLSTLSEVIFGPIPMRLTDETTKIHLLQKYHQVLITKLFQIKLPGKWVEANIFKEKEDFSRSRQCNSITQSSQQSEGHFICRGSFAISVLLSFNINGSAVEKAEQKNIQNLIFTHYPIIERKLSHIVHICYRVIQALTGKGLKRLCEKASIHSIFQGAAFTFRFETKAMQTNAHISRYIRELTCFLYGFLLAPRLPKNLWLQTMYSPSQKVQAFSLFIQHFKNLHVNFVDILKNSIPNYHHFTHTFQKRSPTFHQTRVAKYVRSFLLSIFTTILAHHTSWISPYVHHLGTDTSKKSVLPLSIQMLHSLFGSLSSQNKKKLTRVIVVGSHDYFIRELLVVISFILRCEPIVEREYKLINDTPKKSNPNVNNQSLLHDTSITNQKSVEFLEGDTTESKLQKVCNSFESTVNTDNPASKESIHFNDNRGYSTSSRNKVADSNDVIPPTIDSANFTPLNLVEVSPDSVIYNESYDENCEYQSKYMIPLPEFQKAFHQYNTKDDRQEWTSFGSGLFIDLTRVYCGSFVLCGLPKDIEFMDDAINDLKESLEVVFVDEENQTVEASCIVIDTDRFLCTVIVASKQYQNDPQISFQELETSDYIKEIFKQIDFMEMLNIPIESIYNFFEEKLEELCIYSKAMKEYIFERKKNFAEKKLFGLLNSERSEFSISREEIAKAIDLKGSDIPILEAILKSSQSLDTMDLIKIFRN